MTPIRETDAARDDLEFDRSLIAAIQEASPDGILVVNDRDVIVSHNQRLFDVFGIAPEEIPGDHGGQLVGMPDRPLLSRVLGLVRDQDPFLQRVHALYADPLLEDHCEVELKDGRTLERHSTALWGAQRRYLGRVWFFRDITARKQTEAALQQMSQRDPLTGIANRRHFFERATEEYTRARRYGRHLSFIMLDIDWFKRVNDRWGHAAGDKVLQGLCASALAVLRQTDLFARIGGEEFAVLLPDTDADGAFLLAERLRLNAAAQAVAEGGDCIQYTVSAGVATLAPGDAAAEDALKRADIALYEAKGAGRNRTMLAAGGGMT
jgi:diguanylate cyclase (GGDEF)-like protein/PAS domain S-box-containing protein